MPAYWASALRRGSPGLPLLPSRCGACPHPCMTAGMACRKISTIRSTCSAVVTKGGARQTTSPRARVYSPWCSEDRKYKATFSPRRCHRPPPPAAATCAQRGRLPQHAAAARPSGAQPGGARQGTAWTCRSGWGTVERQGGTGSEGLEAVRRESLGGTISNGIARRKEGKYTAAARTSPTGPRWRGLGRTRSVLGDNGQGQWEVGRTPA